MNTVTTPTSSQAKPYTTVFWGTYLTTNSDKKDIKTNFTKMILVIYGLIILTILLHWHYDFPSIQKGPPRYGDLIHTLREKNFEYTSLHSHERGFYDKMFLWKVQIPEENMRLLTRSSWMKPVEKSAIKKRFYSRSPYWWDPKPNEDNEYFKTDNFLWKGFPASYCAVASWNSDTEIMYMWIKYSF